MWKNPVNLKDKQKSDEKSPVDPDDDIIHQIDVFPRVGAYIYYSLAIWRVFENNIQIPKKKPYKEKGGFQARDHIWPLKSLDAADDGSSPIRPDGRRFKAIY